MKEILNTLMSLNFILKIEKYAGQCRITVSTEDYKFFTQQLLPRDNHLDYALEGCIKFCIKTTLERKAEYVEAGKEGV